MKKRISVFYNKFFLTSVFFIVWMFFLDQNDWNAQRKRKRELQETTGNISYLQEEIAAMEKEYQALTSDPAKLEQYAREHYLMKRDHEDLYIVEGKK